MLTSGRDLAPPFHVAWLEALDATLMEGTTVSPRGKSVVERLGVSVRFDASQALLVHPRRGLNYRFAVAEWLWIAAGRNSVESLTRYNSKMAAFSDDGETLAGAYGPRLRPQWSYVLDRLKTDPDTRQAVASIWTPSPPASRDIPCTLSAQFLLREGRVHGIWTMRSSDLWLGLPYDAFSFARITSCVAGALGVEAGTVQVTAGSSHLYEEHAESATLVLSHDSEARSVYLPTLPGFPPYGVVHLAETGIRIPSEAGDQWFWPPWCTYGQVMESESSSEALLILDVAGKAR